MISNNPKLIRRVIAEDPDWNLFIVPPLSDICLTTLIKSFSSYPVLKEIADINILYAHKFIRGLPPDLPLVITVPLIDNPLYWKNLYLKNWNFCENILGDNGYLWKQCYLERYLSELVENYTPTLLSQDGPPALFYSQLIDDVISVSSPYIRELRINHLQISQPYSNSSNEQFTDGNFTPSTGLEFFNPKLLFSKLQNLRSLDIRYIVKDIGMNFDWSHYSFTKMDAHNLSASICLSLTLLHLGVTSSHLKCSHIKILSNVLIDHPSLTSLDFSHNKIGDSGFKYFGKLLSPLSCHLIHIDLSNNLISADGAILFSFGLERNISLESLNLKLNKLGDDGSEHVFKALTKNSTLKSLNLSSNGLTESSCRILADTFVLNKCLMYLDLCCNTFHESGGKYLQDRIEDNYHLIDLKLSLTHVSQESKTYICQILERNKQLSLDHEAL